VTAKGVLKKAHQAQDEAERKADVAGAQIFQLYANVMSNKSHQLLDRIIKV
jgi:hypothetical protein